MIVVLGVFFLVLVMALVAIFGVKVRDDVDRRNGPSQADERPSAD